MRGATIKPLDIFRAIPRPLGQFLAIGLVWPLWFALGVLESFLPGTGSAVQGQIERGLQSIPAEGWAAIGAIIVAGHWSRSKDKETAERATKTLVEAERSRGVDEPD